MWTLRDATLPLLLLIGILTIAYWYLRRRSTFWAKKGVPFKKPHLFFGNIGDIFTGKRSLTEGMDDIYNNFKGEPFAGIWEITTPKLFVRDPELVRSIFIGDFNCWVDRGGYEVNVDVDPLSTHLINLNGKRWKTVRSKLTPTFTSGKLKRMFYLLLECGREYDSYLRVAADFGEPVDVREMSARFTTDIIGSCAFGIQMNAMNDKDAQFRKIGRKIFQPNLTRKIGNLMQMFCPKLFKILKLSVHPQELTDFFVKLTKETLEYRKKHNIERHDFMDLLRQLKDTGNDNPTGDDIVFDDALLAAQAYVFFAAGFETSSTTISYCMHELAVNEDIQQRLREEVHVTKAKNNGALTFDSLKDMKYLDKVFNETLRKYPPIPVLARVAVKPYTLPGTTVDLPVGMKCFIPIYSIHHDSEHYPEPDRFDPERFSEEAKCNRHPLAFIPFGGGPRNCIGMRFAELQTKLGLAQLVDNFKVSLCEKSQNPLVIDKQARLLAPKGGIWLRISAA